MLTLLADCFILLAGVAYPAYASFKVVKYRNVQGYVRWMCYWVVYAAYTVCERTIGTYFLFWLPGYDIFRCLIVLWLVAPLTRGAHLLYKHVIHPQLSKHESQIDTVCVNYAEALKQGGTGLLRYALGVLFQSVMKMNGLLFSYIHAHSLARSHPGQLQYGNVGQLGFHPTGEYGNGVLASGQEAASPVPGGLMAVGPGYQYPVGQYGMTSPFVRTFSMESLNDGLEHLDQQLVRSRSTGSSGMESAFAPRAAEPRESANHVMQKASSQQSVIGSSTQRMKSITASTYTSTLGTSTSSLSSGYRARDSSITGLNEQKSISALRSSASVSRSSLVSSVLSSYERSASKK